ncbi:zinc-binding alcohol dehydrogenase family protein [Agreia sp.]|uniref:quinone oxidoreductase family protein n=1 Tax=Agreia sp. TaxID=1872416 RepID=UPI0035BBABFF
MATVVQYSRVGGPEVLEVVDVPLPTISEGGLLVEVQAIGVNPVDSKLRSGRRPSPPFDGPRGVGSDASGVVLEVGAAVDGWASGDEVVIQGATGAYASHLVVAPSNLVHKPSVWTWSQAAAVGIPVSTAYQALRSLGVGEGTRLLIHGGTGGVGQAAVQFAVAWGAEVFATASPANHARLVELGAVPLSYGDGLVERVRAASPEGIDVVLDAAGTDEALEASFALVPDRSQIGTIVAGPRAAELGVRAWSGGSPVPLTDEELRLRAEGVPAAIELAAQGRFDVEVSERFPLARAADAQRLSEEGHTRGKIVLIP